jgi:micrococcal nuclease
MSTSRKLWPLLLLFITILACSGTGSDTAPAVPSSAPTATPVSAPAPDDSTVETGEGLPVPEDVEIVKVARVIDGDTIELVDGRRVRYIGINTPERDQPYYTEASEANRQMVGGIRVGLETDQDSVDQYGRTLAYVWANGQMVNLEMVQRGYANIFTVPPNVKYEAEFLAAERGAREAGRGLWAGADVPLKFTDMHANAPGNDNENPNGEWVEVTNQGGEPVDMSGYTLKDAANHIYTFDNFTLAPGETLRLYSGQGQDSPTELYWGYNGESVWNNGSDTAFLRDAEGALVDMYAY